MTEQPCPKTNLRVAFMGRYHPIYRVGMYRSLKNDHGLDITLFSAADNRSGLPTIRSGDVPCTVRQVPEWNVRTPFTSESVTFQPAMVKEVISGNHDVYVIPSMISHLDVWVCLLLGRLLRRKICLWGHGYGPADGFTAKLLRRIMISLSSTHVFYSEPMRSEWVLKGVRSSKLFVAPNALDTLVSERIRAQITPEELEGFRRDRKFTDKLLIVFMGRMSDMKPDDPHDKRPEVLIRAMSRVVREISDAHLVMVGGGPALTRFQHLAGELGLSDRISFPGPVFDEAEIALYLLSARVAAMPGWAGLFVNHVFDYGLPVVIGKLAVSPPETALVENQVTGIVSSAEDPEEFGAAIASLLRSPAKCSEMGAAARHLIRTTYNVQSMAAGMYDAIVAAAGRGFGGRV